MEPPLPPSAGTRSAPSWRRWIGPKSAQSGPMPSDLPDPSRSNTTRESFRLRHVPMFPADSSAFTDLHHMMTASRMTITILYKTTRVGWKCSDTSEFLPAGTTHCERILEFTKSLCLFVLVFHDAIFLNMIRFFLIFMIAEIVRPIYMFAKVYQFIWKNTKKCKCNFAVLLSSYTM